MKTAIRPGDTVTIRVPVIGGDLSGRHGIQVKPRVGLVTFVERDEILAVEGPITAGDQVTWGRHRARYEVLAVSAGMAWLNGRDGYKTVAVDILSHA